MKSPSDEKEYNKDRRNGNEDGPLGTNYEAEDVFAGAEPWDPVETKLVLGSFIAAFVFLVVLGILINIYILK